MNNIDILEELVNAYEDCFVENYNEMIVDVGMRYKDIQAISNIIAENKELKEEIEELKKNNGYHLGFIDGRIAKRYEMEDKIKTKIEEVKDGTYDAKIVLQSLLEKE